MTLFNLAKLHTMPWISWYEYLASKGMNRKQSFVHYWRYECKWVGLGDIILNQTHTFRLGGLSTRIARIKCST